MIRPLAIALSSAALMLAAACAEQEDALRVSNGWIRLSPVPANPSAAYFTLHGGPEATQLIGVKTDRAIRSEIHETMKMGGIMNMQPLRSLDVPAKATIKFEPGGKHVMLWNINPGVKPGARVPLVFTFANGERIQYDAVVQAAGDAAPADEGK